MKKEMALYSNGKKVIEKQEDIDKTKWYRILLQMGISTEDIHKFADANHWLEFFPPIGQADLTRFGYNIDWRRSMITTSRNKY